MEFKAVVKIDGQEELIFKFLSQFPSLSFPCRKIRLELTKLDENPRTSASVEASLRFLFQAGLITRQGNPGRYEYRIKDDLERIDKIFNSIN